ncbi:MAG: hypothetical protein DRQ40_07265 [Gammaproteobacteria bacterium]|nr:MAG: hypothetical protein DRQ40_07265 [Gammaproteobacteria bacterium]
MDLGASPGNSAIVQTISGIIDNAEYRLSFDYLDKAAKQESGQSGEDSGVMEVIWNGEVIATVEGNNRSVWESLSLVVVGGSGDGSDSLIFSEVGDSDDNWGMAIDNVQMSHISYQYDLSISASLTDVDGSETMGLVTIPVDSLPAGVVIDGLIPNSEGYYEIDATTPVTLILTSDVPLTEAQVNMISGSVTSSETVNSDTATTDTTARADFDGLDATGETADLLIEGDDDGNVIIGGTGDDIIFGAGGDDTLTGGGGADELVWTKSDLPGSGVAHDFVEDFNEVEGDVLNLANLLSDGSHEIEGLAADNAGSGQHLQLSIKEAGGSEVQTIDLNNIAVGLGDDPAEMLNNLLDNGNINDGI